MPEEHLWPFSSVSIAEFEFELFSSVSIVEFEQINIAGKGTIFEFVFKVLNLHIILQNGKANSMSNY